MRKIALNLIGFSFILICLGTLTLRAQDIPSDSTSSREVLAHFANPARQYYPKVWWHWMNANITKDGISKDLNWMNRIGISGVQIFDAGLGVPQVAPERLAFMSDEWKDAFGYAVRTANSYGMEVAVPSSGGWSDTGAPWVEPKDAMKTLKWKELVVEGGRHICENLPEADPVAGKYLSHSFFAVRKPEFDYYQDIAVIAVKIPDYDKSMQELGVVLSASDGSDVSGLADSDLNNVCKVEAAAGSTAWVQFAFPEAVTVRSFFSARKDDYRRRSGRHWEVSTDGVAFQSIAFDVPQFVFPYATIDIPATTGKFFRYCADAPGEALDYTELCLYTTTRVNLDTEKAGFFAEADIRDFYPTPGYADATAQADVIDITANCKGGVVDWQAPQGRWRIFRFGYAIRGRRNNPASPEATGLEIDKLDPSVTERYYKEYLGMFKQACGAGAEAALSHLMIDSFEAGCQTWTANMPAEFKARRGYELLPWLPALAGHIIGSSDQTDRFLHDWRQTIGEMLVDYHYNAVDSILAGYGMKRYTEFHESDRHFPTDGMDVKSHADIPMGAFWMYPDGKTSVSCRNDIKESASVAHIYGQNLVAAESFTTEGTIKNAEGSPIAWDVFPSDMKAAADLAMASGLNTFVIHCSPHQPVEDKVPGLSLDVYGLWFHRHETWAHEAKCWTDYLARSSYLLRQGRSIADIAYYISESTNVTDRFKNELAEVPEGYSYDFINRTALLSADFSYRALMIDPEVRSMSIDVLMAIRDLADAGVIIAGGEPATYFGLTDRSEEFSELVRDIWYSGRENVVSFYGAAAALEALGLGKDVDFGSATCEDLHFVHRQLTDAELYWVANTSNEAKEIEVGFDVCGRRPVALRADDGQVFDLPYRTAQGRTFVSLNLEQRDALFVLFAEETTEPERTAAKTERNTIATLDGSWNVKFKSSYTAPAAIKLDKLVSLSEHPSDEVRYFSGTATYTANVKVANPVKGAEYILNLGSVHSLARVRVNGIDCGVAWKAPYRVDITKALKRGSNKIEVEVTNGWANRLIGDEQPGAVPVTWVSKKVFKASDPLHPSGLVGPVSIEQITY